MENLELLYSFFNQYIFNTAKQNISNIEYYYQTNPNTMTNPLVNELISAIKTYELDAIGSPLFKSILMRCNKSPEESAKIMDDIRRWKLYSKEQIAPAAKYLSDICAAAVLQKAGRLYQESPSDYLKYLKNVDYHSSDIEIFTATPFDRVDINTIIADESKGAISTNVDLINRAFAPHNGIERGQLFLVSAPPGVGKTLFAMNLACWMASHGEKVLYVSLADMNMKDFIVRMGSIAFGIPFANAYKNISGIYDNLKKMVGNNLEVSINAAGQVSADDIVEKVMAGNYSVVFVDYDGVIKGVTEGDSMYNTFGEVYNTFTKLSMSGKLCIIASQPKVFAYDKLIGLADIGESSKKQQVVDAILTISNVNPDCPNHLYIMQIPKARRGRVGSKAYVIRLSNGRFKEIPKGVYDQLRLEQEEKEYTEQEIDNMIHAFNVQYDKIKQNTQQMMNNMAAAQGQNINTSGLKNPFGI